MRACAYLFRPRKRVGSRKAQTQCWCTRRWGYMAAELGGCTACSSAADEGVKSTGCAFSRSAMFTPLATTSADDSGSILGCYAHGSRGDKTRAAWGGTRGGAGRDGPGGACGTGLCTGRRGTRGSTRRSQSRCQNRAGFAGRAKTAAGAGIRREFEGVHSWPKSIVSD